MGREVRKVPADWKHPKNYKGEYISLHDGGGFAQADADWSEAHARWQDGYQKDYGGPDKWIKKSAQYAHMRYTEYSGPRPSPDDYMPNWPPEKRTHFMMYENTSEGTPISPAFATPEELAQWLFDNKASAFANSTGSYEGWLRVAKDGWAPSMVIVDGVIKTGVDAFADGLPMLRIPEIGDQQS